jgi:hypothetical protein
LPQKALGALDALPRTLKRPVADCHRQRQVSELVSGQVPMSWPDRSRRMEPMLLQASMELLSLPKPLVSPQPTQVLLPQIWQREPPSFPRRYLQIR